MHVLHTGSSQLDATLQCCQSCFLNRTNQNNRLLARYQNGISSRRQRRARQCRTVVLKIDAAQGSGREMNTKKKSRATLVYVNGSGSVRAARIIVQ